MIVVIGTVTAREGCLDAMLALGRAHVARSRTEPGCLSHAMHLDAEEPNRLVFVEEWTDLAALQRHLRLPASQTFGRAIAEIASAPPRLTLYDARKLEA